jgi:signal transduction histidine kinase
LAAVIALVGVGVATEVSARPVQTIVGAAVAITFAIPLFALRRRWAVPFALAVGTGIALVATGRSANLAWFGICILGGWCALIAGSGAGVAFLAASALLFASEWVVAVHDPGWAAWIAGTALTVFAASLVRQQRALVEQMRVLQADLAQRERADERTRIARELHDVIAHSLTVSLLHISSARLAIEAEPSDAARSLADAERLTRQSLDDVRATVGVLRSPGDDGIAHPAPGIDDVQQLVDDLRATHADISLTREGDLSQVPATTGTTAYRIVQEALTNASRHAPGAPVEVRVALLDDCVEVSVDSTGAPGSGTGMGLLNMKERAEAVGGTCSAGPGGHGWLVTASLPRRPSANGDRS